MEKKKFNSCQNVYDNLISVSTKQNTMILSVVGRVALTLRSELILNELMNSKLIYYCCIQYFNTSISQKFNLKCSAECCTAAIRDE